MPGKIGTGVIDVAFDPQQIAKAGQEQLLPAGKRLATDLASAFVGVKLIDIGRQGLDELKQAATAQSNVEAVIRATGGSANVTAEHIDELANRQLKLTGVDDELIKQGAAKLLTFRNVADRVGEGNDVLDRAIKLSLDLAQLGFGSVESASVLLGKALNDPIIGLTALNRAGVTFSEGQKETIKQLVATGDLLGAQKVILGEVEHQVGGTAAAYGDELPGKIAIAQQSLDNMKGQLVAAAAPALEFVADKATLLTEKFDELPEGAQQAIGSVVVFGGAVGALIRPIHDAVEIYDVWRDGQKAGVAAAEAAATANEAVAASQTAGATASQAAAAADGEAALAAAGLSATEAESAAAIAARNEQMALQSIADGGATLSAAGLISTQQALALSEAEVATNSAATVESLYAQSAAMEANVASTSAASTGIAGMAAAFGPLAIGAGIGAAALAVFGDGTTDLDSKVKELASTADNEVLPAFRRLDAFDQTKLLRTLIDSGDAGVGVLVRLRNAAAAAGEDTRKYDSAIQQAKQGHDQLKASADAGAHALGNVNDVAAEGPDSEHAKALATWYDAIRKNADDAFTASLKLAPADIRAQEGRLAIADASDKVTEAETKLDYLRKAKADPKKIADAERDLEKARLDQQTAVLNEATALAELASQQQAAATGTGFNAEETQNFTEGALKLLVGQLDGPTRTAIETYIFNLEILRQKIIAVRTEQEAAANYTPPTPDIGQRPDGTFDPRLVPPTIKPSPGGRLPNFASGGSPTGAFIGAEQGYEVLLHEGVYQGRPGDYVLNHRNAEAFMTAQGGGRGDFVFQPGAIVLQHPDARSALRRLPDELRAAAYLAGV